MVVRCSSLAGRSTGSTCRWWMPVARWPRCSLAYAAVHAAVALPVHRWEVTDTAVYTQTGWWRRERRIAPMSRIQTVDYVEGAISRLFGLATVTVTTASAAGALEIAGLDRDRRPQPGRRADPQGRRGRGRRHVTEPDRGDRRRSRYADAATTRVAAARPADAAGAPDPGADPLPARADRPAAWPGRAPAGTSGGGSCWASASRSRSACCAT